MCLLGLVALWALAAGGARAAEVVVAPGADAVDLAPFLEVHVDPAGALDLDTVAAERGGTAAFRPLRDGPQSFGQSTGAVWGRVRLDLTAVDAVQGWLLAIQTLLIERADLYVLDGDGRLLMHEARGLSVDPVPAGTIQYAADLTRFAGRAVTVYLRVQSRFTLVITPVLRTALAQERHESEMLRIQAPLVGSIVSMLLLFFVHWLLLHNRLYGYAFGTALGVAITALFGSGLNRAYWLNWGGNVDWWVIESGAVIGLHCLPLFAAAYLGIDDRRPRLYRALGRVVCVMSVVNLATMVLLPYRLITLLTLSFFFVSAIAVWLMAFQRGPGRRERATLILAMVPFLLLNSVHLVAFNRWAPGFLPWRDVVPHLFNIAMATLLLGFALAVADQIRFRLATLVEQRTKQLVDANLRTEEALVAEQTARQRLRQFIRMAAHEFKTPLAVIDGAAQVLPLLIAPVAADAQRRLDNIRANVGRLLTLIEACFAEDRLDEAGLVLHVGAFDPVDLVNEVAQHQRLLHGRTVRVRAVDAPALVAGDLELLRMVFNALLDNAAKYSPPSTAVEVEIGAAPGGLRVAVRDRGRGIPAPDREKLFARYFRASNVTSVPGTGLGLYLARSIVTKHGGTLGFADRDGGGTEFVVEIPTEASADPRAVIRAAAPCSPDSAPARR